MKRIDTKKYAEMIDHIWSCVIFAIKPFLLDLLYVTTRLPIRTSFSLVTNVARCISMLLDCIIIRLNTSIRARKGTFG